MDTMNAKHRILVVEDETHLANGIKLNLELDGYHVDIAPTVRDARRFLVGQEAHALIILDVMLPDMNGMEFCAHVRASGNHIPILMLTALGDSRERVRGLRAGADDYLPKPFDLDELLARVASLIRRSDWQASTSTETVATLRFGGAEIDFRSRRAVYCGESVNLTKLEYDLLEFFAQHPVRVISREELLEEVWGIQHSLSTRTVDNFVLRLRKLFEEEPSRPKYILSVRGSGYQFCPEGWVKKPS
jgi:DNA-binding response OmpR family regulator